MTENTLLEEYYRETSPTKRGELLDELLSGEDGEENRLRRELYGMRYDQKNRGTGGEPADRFMALWMLIKVSANTSGGFFGRKSVHRDLTKEFRKIGITKFQEAGELERELLAREFYHLAATYIKFSRGDRSYGSAVMGLVALKDDQVRAKLAEDIYTVSIKVPRDVGMEEQFALLAKAAREAFIDILPEDRHYLDDLISGDQP